MAINFVQLKGVVRELKAVQLQLKRIADLMEADLALKGYNVTPPKADMTGDEPTLVYVEEDIDWARENIKDFDKLVESSGRE